MNKPNAPDPIDLLEARKRLVHKVVVFGGPSLAECDIDFFEKQKARVAAMTDVSVDDTPDGTVWKVEVDFSEFEAHNIALALPVYYDKEGNPTLKWHQTIQYPPDQKTHFYISPKPHTWPFSEILDDGCAAGPVVLSADDWKKITTFMGDKVQELGIRPL